MEFTYFDQVIHQALDQKQKVELCLSKGEEGGFGIKINGKIVSENNPWEIFEYQESEMDVDKGTFDEIVKNFAKQKESEVKA